MDNDRIYRVKVTLSTVIGGDSESDAMDQVASTFPVQFEFGEFGNRLPFEYERMDVAEVFEADLPRP